MHSTLSPFYSVCLVAVGLSAGAVSETWPSIASSGKEYEKCVNLPEQPLKILFVHQNFPAQFKHLAPALIKEGHEVTALHRRNTEEGSWQGVRMIRYPMSSSSTPGVHPWVVDFESKVMRGEACMQIATRLQETEGYSPDVIVAHPGWGESLFLKEVWPNAKMGIFCEFYYSHKGLDTGFDDEFPSGVKCEACRTRVKNVYNHMQLDSADAAISPTRFQASTYPEQFQSKMTVVFDGVDTVTIVPNPQVTMKLAVQSTGKSIELTRQNEVVTFVTRNFEPLRGYHIFMRALPGFLKRRPNARIILVGGNSKGYGKDPDPTKYGNLTSWKDIFISEVRPLVSDADWSRVHFVGKVSQPTLVKLLQLSSVHVYLTYPFVLSWSLIEAMSIGCTIVASDTKPLHEVIEHGETGRLVDFFNVQSLTDEICDLLNSPTERARLSFNARNYARQNYDIKSVCLPRQLEWVYALAQRDSCNLS